MSAQHRAMDDQFEARLQAWLDDPKAETSGEQLATVADGYEIAKRAIAAADAHPTCGRDPRTYTVVIGVTGADGEETIHEITPEHTLMCVLGVLQRDPDVAGMQVYGILAETYEEPEPAAEIVVVSENPDLEVSWNDEPAEPWVPEAPRAVPAGRPVSRLAAWLRTRRSRGQHFARPGDPYTYPMTEWTEAAPDEVGPFDQAA